MQELRSTEILDKEIQEDAQKKVLKIRQNSEAECNAIISSVDEKIAQAEKEKDETFSKKINAFEKNQKASVPLEKERYKVSFVQNLILENVNEYLKNLTEEKRIQLVLQKVNDTKLADLIKNNKFNAFIYGFDLKKVEKELSKSLGKNLVKVEATEFGKLVLEDENIELKEGVILESEDKNIRLRLTLSEVIGQLLDKNRAELSNALFGVQG